MEQRSTPDAPPAQEPETTGIYEDGTPPTTTLKHGIAQRVKASDTGVRPQESVTDALIVQLAMLTTSLPVGDESTPDASDRRLTEA